MFHQVYVQMIYQFLLMIINVDNHVYLINVLQLFYLKLIQVHQMQMMLYRILIVIPREDYENSLMNELNPVVEGMIENPLMLIIVD